MGGYSYDKNYSKEEKIKLEKNLIISLKELKNNEVEIIPQTMPHFHGTLEGRAYIICLLIISRFQIFVEKINIEFV